MIHRRELSLVQEAGSQRVFIEHEPNVSSGGRTTNIEVADFLTHGGHDPEHQALLRLIGSLVEERGMTGDAGALIGEDSTLR